MSDLRERAIKDVAEALSEDEQFAANPFFDRFPDDPYSISVAYAVSQREENLAWRAYFDAMKAAHTNLDWTGAPDGGV